MYARQLNDVSVYLTTANASNDAPQDGPDSQTCLDVLQPMLGAGMRPLPGLPRTLKAAISKNVRWRGANCASPSCESTNVSIWSAYCSESAAYGRNSVCPYVARLVQLSADACVGFDSRAFGAPQTSEDADELACDAQSSTSARRCLAMLVMTRDQGRSTTHLFPPAEHSALADLSTTCTVRSIGVDAGDTSFALVREGRDCFGGTVYSLIEEIYVL
ncbi:TPA: hypothetical protein QDC22_007316 [Burkholderia stabilis]|nr:hypothetical protein [Burkholderia stabilis]HDR9653403.1 hypothetical protein [Burkholderia stabilis]HDR9660290.1 hypothetical protein [Burkholderia stabilis]HDR9683875.1 hypothetical protein [Burkholderia stabilis]